MQNNKIDRFSGVYRFLSNFWPVIVELDGIDYPSVENAYQAAKTTDSDQRRFFHYSPEEAKKRGRTIPIRTDWDEIKQNVMLDLLRQKFRNSYLRGFLLSTENAELIEGNWWGDTYWGVCNGKGENILGKLLMQVRQEICDAD